MSDADIDPLTEAKADAVKWGRRTWHSAVDLFRRYVTAALLKVALAGIVSIGLAIAALPAFAIAAAVIANGGLIVYAVYATRLLKRQEAARRWEHVSVNRLQMQVLKAEDAADRAVLAVLGEDRHLRSPSHPIELRQAVAYLRSTCIAELAAAQASVLPQPARQGRVAPAPDVSAVRSRMKVREAKLREYEARIQSLAVPENVDALLAAEDAMRSRRQIEDDAFAADRAARENHRQGRTASPSSRGINVQMAFTPTGVQSMTQRPAPLTPEQISRGESRGSDVLVEAAGRGAAR